MGKYRKLVVALLFIAVIQGSAQASLRSAMSPAGQAIYKAVVDKVTADLLNVMRAQNAVRKQIDLQLKAEHPDWKVLNALLQQDFSIEIHRRKISDALEHSLLDRLPEADRILYLRSRFPPDPGPPTITVAPKH